MIIQIVGYDEGSFIMSTDISKDQFKEQKIGLRIKPQLKYRQDDDIVGAFVTITYTAGEKQILFYEAGISLFVEGWKELLSSRDFNTESARQFLFPVWEYALNIVRGVLLEKTRNTILAQSYLPQIDINEFSSAVTMKDVTKVEI